jgi:hypothetical protein
LIVPLCNTADDQPDAKGLKYGDLKRCQARHHALSTSICLWQVKAHVEEAKNPTKHLQASHAPSIAQEVEILCKEILEDNKPLSKVKIVTNDDAILGVLGVSGILMAMSAWMQPLSRMKNEQCSMDRPLMAYWNVIVYLPCRALGETLCARHA